MTGIRIGQKLIQKEKIYRIIDEVLGLRSKGLSQQEVAEQMGIDRSFVSKLEGLGEVRKGKSVAVLGFPIANKVEVIKVLKQAAVDDWFILTEQERLQFVGTTTGKELTDKLMDLITRYRRFDILIVLTSDRRLKLVQSLVDCEVVGLEIGPSPLTADQTVPIDQLRNLLQGLGLIAEERNYSERRIGTV